MAQRDPPRLPARNWVSGVPCATCQLGSWQPVGDSLWLRGTLCIYGPIKYQLFS